jgi:hypothetical protein
MNPKRRTKEKGTFTSEVDGKEVELTGKKVVVVGKDGLVKKSKFVGKGKLADGTRMKVRDVTRFK